MFIKIKLFQIPQFFIKLTINPPPPPQMTSNNNSFTSTQHFILNVSTSLLFIGHFFRFKMYQPENSVWYFENV